MKNLLLATLAISLSGCLNLGRPVDYYQPKSVVEDAVSDVVTLHNEGGYVFCSGVITQGYILTAAHCMDDGERHDVTIGYRGVGDVPTGQHKAKILYLDVDHDVALLEGITEEMRYGRLLAPEAPVVGSKAVAVGHPLGLVWTLTEGIVVRPRRCLWGWSPMCMMQMSMPLSPGNSGGAIYNSYGEVIGIASFHMTGHQHLSGATAWVDLKAIMEKVKDNE